MPEIIAEVDRPNVPATGTTVKAAIGIQPGMQEETVSRQIAICVDVSGSMTGEKMEQVREGILWVFGYLEEDDYISIVAFDDDVEVVLDATRWGNLDRSEAEAAVDGMTAGGGTNIRGGLERAHETLQGLPTGPGVGRRILLLSDGRDNTPIERFAEMARRIRREDHIAIPSAGIGEFYDEDIIRTIGTESDGEWIHLAHASDIGDFFGRKVENLSTVVAPNPHLEMDLAPGTGVDEVYLRAPQVQDLSWEHEGNTVRIFLPDLLEFERQEVVMELHTPECSLGDRITLADVTLHTRLGSGTGSERGSIVVECTDDPEQLETVIQDVGVKHMDTMVRKAASEGDIEAAETMIDRATRVVPDEEVSAMETVVEKARDGDMEAQYMTTIVQDDPR